MPRFAANLSLMFTERPLLDRFAAAADAGFAAVELQFPYEHPADAIAQRLAAAGLELTLFNLSPGDWAAGAYEKLVLDGFQAGLAWITILR
ncbi:hydroxypyruvate isomerase, partial [Hansschlegelia beijingensis]